MAGSSRVASDLAMLPAPQSATADGSVNFRAALRMLTRPDISPRPAQISPEHEECIRSRPGQLRLRRDDRLRRRLRRALLCARWARPLRVRLGALQEDR